MDVGPEQAIAAFERLHRVVVTVHDPAGGLRGALGAERGIHRHRGCILAKGAGRLDDCLAFDVERTRRDLAELPDGRVQICHAGLVECVVPILRDGRVAAVLFAGPWWPARDLRPHAVDERRTRWPPGASPLRLPRLDAERAWLLLEALRQLRARLEQWMAAHPAPAAGRRPRTADDRRAQVLDYLRAHHQDGASLTVLARCLGVSPSRCAHVVRAVCGAGFSELLMRQRLETARDLLARTSLPVGRVLAAAGFRNRSHFHAAFRRRFGVTPSRWRATPRWGPTSQPAP